MLKDLVKVANRLDSLGLTREADIIDGFIQKMAAYTDFGGGFDEGQGEDSGPFPFDIKLKALKEKARMTAILMGELLYSDIQDVGEQRGIYMNNFYEEAESMGFARDFADLVYEDEFKRLKYRYRF